MQTVITTNHSSVDVPIVSELDDLRDLVIKPNSKLKLEVDVPPGLKVFCRRVIINKRQCLWVGLIDKNANL